MPSLASFPSMMQRDRKRKGLRECRAAWLIGVLLALGIGVICWTVAAVFGFVRRKFFSDPSKPHKAQYAPRPTATRSRPARGPLDGRLCPGIQEPNTTPRQRETLVRGRGGRILAKERGGKNAEVSENGLGPGEVRSATMWGLAGVATLGLIGTIFYAGQSGNFWRCLPRALRSRLLPPSREGCLASSSPSLEDRGLNRSRRSAAVIRQARLSPHRPATENIPPPRAFARTRISKTFPIG